jgi:DHA2 family methylenomycin A resistance protein-like MFS transporter
MSSTLTTANSQAWDSFQKNSFIVAAFAIVVGLFSFSTAPYILTAIGEELNFSVDNANLLRIAPPAASLLAVFIAGALGDVFGSKKVLLGGAGIYCIGILIVLTGQSFGLILAGRALEGIGAMLLRVLSLALVASAFPTAAQRAIAFSCFAAVSPITQILGPSIAAPLAGIAGWRSVVAIWLLLGIVFVGVAFKLLPRDETRTKGIEFTTPILAGLALVLLSSSISAFQASPQRGSFILGLAIISIVFLVVLIKRFKAPSFDFTLPSQPGAIFVLIALAASNVADPIFFTALYLQKQYNLVIAVTGFALIPLNFGSAIGNLIAGPIMARVGAYKTVLIGFLISAAVAMSLVFLKPDTPAAIVVCLMSSFMLFKMMGSPALLATIMGLVPSRLAGVASSWWNASQILGVAIGGVLVGSILFNTFQDSLSSFINNSPLSTEQSNQIATLIRQGNRELISVDPAIMPIADLNTLIDPDGQAVNMAQAMAYRTLGPIMALANVATCLALWFSKRSQTVANRQS